jgi:hypothetical protein
MTPALVRLDGVWNRLGISNEVDPGLVLMSNDWSKSLAGDLPAFQHDSVIGRLGRSCVVPV